MSILEIYWTALHHTTETRRTGWCGGFYHKKHEKQTLQMTTERHILPQYEIQYRCYNVDYKYELLR